MQVAVHAHGNRLHASEVALPASAVKRGVAVQDLAPPPAFGDSDLVVVARHRGEVEDADEQVLRRLAPAHQAHDALVRVGAVDPGEARGVEVELMERLFLAKYPVEVAYPEPQAAVHRVLDQMPVETLVVRSEEHTS